MNLKGALARLPSRCFRQVLSRTVGKWVRKLMAPVHLDQAQLDPENKREMRAREQSTQKVISCARDNEPPPMVLKYIYQVKKYSLLKDSLGYFQYRGGPSATNRAFQSRKVIIFMV